MRNFGALLPGKLNGVVCEFTTTTQHLSVGSVVGVGRLFAFGWFVVWSDSCGIIVVFGKNVICFVSIFERNTHENR